MFSHARELLRRLTKRIGDGATRITAGGISPRYRGTAQIAATSRRDFTDIDRQAGYAVDAATAPLTPPFEHAGRLDRRRLPPRQLTVREYLRLFERKTGREPTPDDLRTIFKGCVGVVAHYLGSTGDRMLPQHLAFGDPRTHRELALIEEVLTHGDQANAKAQELSKLLETAQREYELMPTTHKGIIAEAARKALERAEDIAEATAARLPTEFRQRLLEYREITRREGNWATFERVSEYESTLMRIFAVATDADQVKRMIVADNALSHIPHLDRDLPSSHPSRWRIVKVHHQFWTGQDDTADHATQSVGAPTPHPWQFQPDPTTGYIDMSMDRQLAKPGGFMNFDFAVYEPDSKTWLSANNALSEESNPIRVLQFTTDRLFSGSTSFDGSCIYMIITDQGPSAG
ncbi:hypothetical protein [Nocardia brasiliensis]|uniref:hypothetical protein n=1 Tax=Nocardia brasiliensis TaxID=37326 RepID=UPI00245701FD|nr:hypothetical protein [Nocardia brasiliensis]